MKSVYVTIDTQAVGMTSGFLGRVTSVHRSLEAAVDRATKLTRAAKREHGPSAYSWVEARELKQPLAVGDDVYSDDIYVYGSHGVCGCAYCES